MIRRGRLPHDHLLALRAALLPSPEAEEAYAEWRALVDFDATDAPTYRLLPLIYRNLRSRPDADPVLGRMRGIYRQTWVLNAIQLEEGERAIAALAEHNVPTMLLKGAAMLARWTDDSGVRMMADFDLLVPRELALEAVSRLLESGWRPAVDRSDPLTEIDLDGEHAILLRSERRGELDLHWRALLHGSGDAADDALWARAEEIRLGAVCTRVPAAEDHVHHACSHATTWTAAGRVDWIADAALILREVGPAFDWARVLDLARRDRSALAVDALTTALGEVLGERVPPPGYRHRFRVARPAIAERVELSLRGRMPHERGGAAELFLALQDHRRRSRERSRRSLVASIPSFARTRWRVEGLRGVTAQAAYHALGRPRWLRRSLLRRVRTRELSGRDLATVAAGSLDLRADGNLRESLLGGWSFAESGGRWTDGSEAALALRATAPANEMAVDVTTVPLLHPKHPALDVEVWVNDRYVATWAYRLDEEAPPRRRFVLSKESLAGRDVLEIAFVLRDPCRPMTLGVSQDPRKLGLLVRELRFSTAR
jgi:Uncharacterised nucleotidyltransferase